MSYSSFSAVNAHVVSPRQVIRLIDCVYDKTSRFKASIEHSSNNFFNEMSKCWEDDNAIIFAREMKKKLDDLITVLSNECSSLVDVFIGYAESYSRAGGKGGFSPNISKRNFSSAIDISKVKSMFDDESFGIKDTQSLNNFFKEYQILISDCEKYSSGLRDDILKINAFENENVKNQLFSFAHNLTSANESKFKEIDAFAHNEFDKIINAYTFVSKQTIDKGNGIVEEVSTNVIPKKLM